MSYVCLLFLFPTVVFQHLQEVIKGVSWLDYRHILSPIVCDTVTLLFMLINYFDIVSSSTIILISIDNCLLFAWWLFVLFLLISWVHLTTTTYVRRIGRITDGMRSDWTTLQDSALSFLTPAPTLPEWPSQEEPGSGLIASAPVSVVSAPACTVAIGNPERHVRKTSHRGSKQQ